MLENLVLAGCQLKGLAYIGVVKYLEELNIMDDIKTICGVSSGSIFALALCLGFTSYELQEISMKLSIEDLKSSAHKSVFKLFDDYGFDDGSQFIKLFKIILEKKTGNAECTFSELKQHCDNKKLMVIGTNLTMCTSEIFSEDTTPEMKVYDAVRISISFPLVFSKVCYNDFCYSDGGILSNYPIDLFQNKLDTTLGIVVNSHRDISNIGTFDQYLLRILYLLSFQKQELLCEKYKDQSVKILVTYGLLSVKFDTESKKYLIEEGYKQFKEQFNYEFFYKDSKKTDTISQSINIEKKEPEIEDDIKSLLDEIKDKISIENKNNNLNNIIDNI